ncbi:MAG: glycosyl hydrolase [Sulfurimonas sp.]|uniref:glycoside hydrolase family 17 protein n=1 Tax=Sulfurimonas sp. TaxID=2022749 RepID=UPI002634EF22|nr:glycosyl hydrolase [Sulfurimonas sp.]MDD2652997.1 glycosyl hydrolase [Sulfurimonas sp.]MDD3452443.1 glycosyl hydrolase [Sulfurimonas sp.]
MIKKTAAVFTSVVVVVLFWYLLGEVFVLKDGKNSFDKLECVSYAPFGKNDSPFSLSKGMVVSEDLVRNDLKLLSKYTTCIRTYSTVGLEIVPKIARENSLKMYMGAWVSSDKVMTQKEITTLIKLAKENQDIIKGVIVGNEVLLRGDATEAVLSGYIKQVKEALPNTEVTYADVWEYWVKHPQIKDITDFVTIHILPYWEDDPMNIDQSIGHLADVRGEVTALLKDKKILIGETGWPSEGRAREDAIPSKINQALFVREFVALAQRERWNYNIIEAFDQPWKRVSEGAVGGFWGLFDKDRVDKHVFGGDVSNFVNYKLLALCSVTLILLFSLLFKNTQIRTREIILFGTFNTLFALLFTLQLEQYSVTARTVWEFLWAFLVMSVHALVYYFTLAYIAFDKKVQVVVFREIFTKKIKGPDASLTLLFYAASLLATIITISLAFDGRYRNFEIYAFSISVISFLWLYRGMYREFVFGLFEKVLFVVLAVTTIIVFVNETYLNLFSNLWALIAFGFAYLLFMGSIKVSYGKIKEILFAILVSGVVFAFIKYGYLSNSAFTAECAAAKGFFLCDARAWMAHMLYLGYLGAIALFGAVMAYFTYDRVVSYGALALSVGAIVLLNTTLGAIAFLLSLMIVAKIEE